MRTNNLWVGVRIGALAIPVLVPTVLSATDELIAEQQYSIAGVAESAHAFWDANLWRIQLGGGSRLPVAGDFLYFQSKGFDGTPFATPASNFTLHTGAYGGFTPPVGAVAFSRLAFSANQNLTFSGVPDVVGQPLGRFNIAFPHPLQLLTGSTVTFDRSILQAYSALINDGSSLTFKGNPLAYGEPLSARFTGPITAQRTGAAAAPVLEVRDQARVSLYTLSYGFALHPSNPNAGTGPVVRTSTGGVLNITSTVLTNPTGIVFDAGDGFTSVSLSDLDSTGGHPTGDPLVVFNAAPLAMPYPIRTYTLTNLVRLQDFKGSFANLSSGASLTVGGSLYFVQNNQMDVNLDSGSSLALNDLVTSAPFSPGTARLRWTAAGGSSLTVNQLSSPALDLDGGSHFFRAQSGGTLTLPGPLEFQPTAQVAIESMGTGSAIRLLGNTFLSPDNFLANPLGSVASFSLVVSTGGTLSGGPMVDIGGGVLYPQVSALQLQGVWPACTVNVAGGKLEQISLGLPNGATALIGSAGTTTTLQHTTLILGDGASATLNNVTWQPADLSSVSYTQAVTAGNRSGGTSVTLTGGTTAHAVDFEIGPGFFVDGALPAITPSTLTIAGGSTVSGRLIAAQLDNGLASTTVTGAGTNAGFRTVGLGASATPQQDFSGPPGEPPAFSGNFFFSRGGSADLSVLVGGRVSVGSFAGPFGTWLRPDAFQKATFTMNGSTVTIDPTGALYVGDAASPAGFDYRNGKLVVGPEGFLMGTGVINGAGLDGTDVVIAGGSVRPGFSPGTLEVDGGLVMESGELILEIESNGSGGFDVLRASSINLTGGTLRIKPTASYAFAAGFSGDLFDTTSLTIGPGVSVVMDPLLSGASFNPATGELIVPPTDDGNANGVPDMLEDVLPIGENGRHELPVMTRVGTGAPTFTFRRMDFSIGQRSLIVQWSTNLQTWTDIEIPETSAGDVTITPNGFDPDQISVLIPAAVNEPRVFIRLQAAPQ